MLNKIKQKIKSLRKVVVYRVEMPLDDKNSLATAVSEAKPGNQLEVSYVIGISEDGIPYMRDILIANKPKPKGPIKVSTKGK